MFEVSRIASCGAGVMSGCTTRDDTQDKKREINDIGRMTSKYLGELRKDKVKRSKTEEKEEEVTEGNWEGQKKRLHETHTVNKPESLGIRLRLKKIYYCEIERVNLFTQ